MQNNKGFSLVELIVAVAILAIVCVAVGAMLSSGSNLFASINESETVASDMQLAMAQIRNVAVDSTDVYTSITATKERLFLGNRNTNDYYYFVIDSAKAPGVLVMYYYKDMVNSTAGSSKNGVICYNVTSFTPTITNDGLLTVTLVIDGHTETQNIAMRSYVAKHKNSNYFKAAISREG